MNILNGIREIRINNLSLSEKIDVFKNLIQGYLKLEKGILDKSVFEATNLGSKEIDKLIDSLDERDYKIIKNILTENTKHYLKNLKLKKYIDFNDKRDFLQVGMNTIFIEGIFPGLWTTGKATFFLPVSNTGKNTLTLEIFSFIPTSIIIGQENKMLKKFYVKKFQTKKIDLHIEKFENSIVEIFVDIEKRWRPNIVTKNAYEIPLGVKIKSIRINDS